MLEVTLKVSFLKTTIPDNDKSRLSYYNYISDYKWSKIEFYFESRTQYGKQPYIHMMPHFQNG